MFTGGHCHSRAIPSALPPRRKRPSSSLRYAVPPLLNYPPPPQNLLLLSMMSKKRSGGFFLRAYFRGDGARRKKDRKIVCSRKVICYLTYVRIDSNNQQQPTKTKNYHHETLLRFIRQLHRPQPCGALKWLCQPRRSHSF